jgi:hypothetical protein
MALRAIDVATTEASTRAATQPAGSLRTPLLAPPRTIPASTEPTGTAATGTAAISATVGIATITELRPRSRVEALAAARRERRRWAALGVVVFFTPFAACLGVLEVVR